MGHQYYGQQLPDLIRVLERIATCMEKGQRLDIPGQKEIDEMSELDAAKLVQSLVPEVQIVKKEPVGNSIPDTFAITRLGVSFAENVLEDPDILESTQNHGDVIAVYRVSFDPMVAPLNIVEYTDGKFWTYMHNDDYIGTLTGCIDFLIKSI